MTGNPFTVTQKGIVGVFCRSAQYWENSIDYSDDNLDKSYIAHY